MYIIPRSSIPSINSVEKDNILYRIGLVGDFRKHSMLKELLPESGRFSISWVRLNNQERLEPHRHPEASMIIITEGAGETIGELSEPIKAGDIIFVPPGCLHGFIGGGTTGFWGLSIQFEGLGLYEDPQNPKVIFESEVHKQHNSQMSSLMVAQNKYLAEYSNNPIILLLKSELIKEEAVQKRFFSNLHYWSNVFQRVLFAKAAFGINQSEFQKLSEVHIAEEIGHNNNFTSLGCHKEKWHPALAAASAWFVEQMMILSDPEKVILVNFVLEGSGKIFHSYGKDVFLDIEHFCIHDEHDEEHFVMGYQLLNSQTNLDFNQLHHVLDMGWKMINHLCFTIAQLSVQDQQFQLNLKV